MIVGHVMVLVKSIFRKNLAYLVKALVIEHWQLNPVLSVMEVVGEIAQIVQHAMAQANTCQRKLSNAENAKAQEFMRSSGQ